MTRLLMLVEGPSEELFVKRTLAPHLAQHGVFVQGPTVIETKRMREGGKFRGGVVSWSQLQRNLRPLLADGDAWVTTLMDFYGLPQDVPGWADAQGLSDPIVRAMALQDSLSAAMGKPERFLPFLTLHEFEALLYSAPGVVAAHFGDARLKEHIGQAVAQAGGAEQVNQGAQTHPKARLKRWVPQFSETADGPVLMAKIGLEAVRSQCPHFCGWLTRLERLQT